MTNTYLSVTPSTTPRQLDAATEARLADIDRDATPHVEGNRPQHSRDPYAAGRKAWEKFSGHDPDTPQTRYGTILNA
ncbi:MULTISPECIES: hypothetical protein [unclassified Streptomyces]|uniref:hypothetical protein n=1 Tax=unclassified Streptomyces TaxID=2593676 RepID=UPI003D8ABF8C